MKPINGLSVWIGAAALAFASVACNNTATGLKQDAEENKREAAEASAEARQKADEAADRTAAAADRAGDKAESAADRAADKTADAADHAGNAMSKAAHETAQKTEEVTKDAGRTTDAAVQTVDVKSALIADKRVDASGINVDTDAATKTVILKGHVPTAAQKTLAANIAKSHAEGYKIKNELSVGN